MDQSIMHRNPELEASFSFSGYDFINSSDLCVFSNVEGGEWNDNEYIEIALEQPTKHADYNDDDDDGLELRISFSSVPFLELSHNNNTGLSRTTTVESLGCESTETVTTPSSSTSSSSTSTSTLSCSSADTYWAAASATHPPSSINKRKVQFRAVNRLLGSFLSIPRSPSQNVEKSDTNSTPEHESTKQVAIHTNTNHHLELFQTRKSPKITKSTNGGIMMKLLIKCRSINIRTLLASLVKPYQIIINAPLQGGGQKKRKKRSSNNKSSSSSSLDLVKPFEKWLVQKDKTNNNNNNGERSRVFEMNMDAIRGVSESMSITNLGRRDKNKIIKKSSTNTTMTQGNTNESKFYATTDNSIQAAIAHCKTSFGQPSDFCS